MSGINYSVCLKQEIPPRTGIKFIFIEKLATKWHRIMLQILGIRSGNNNFGNTCKCEKKTYYYSSVENLQENVYEHIVY